MSDNGEIRRLVDEFLGRQYLLDMGKSKLALYLKTSVENILIAKKMARDLIRPVNQFNKFEPLDEPSELVDKSIKFNKFVSRQKNILVVGDTHIPYEKEGYLDFCIEQYDKWNCDTVIHIGDLIDSHATSRHPSIPDAYSAGDELSYTIRKLRSWYKAFPNMKVCIGNHDIRSYKIAAEYGIASKWMKGFADALEVPNWEFEESFEINGIVYTHGTGTTGQNAAHLRALNLGQSVVMGHLHSESSIIYHQIASKTIFGMIVGCGVDEKSYGMNYAKNFPRKSIMSCGIILGDQPILAIMK